MPMNPSHIKDSRYWLSDIKKSWWKGISPWHHQCCHLHQTFYKICTMKPNIYKVRVLTSIFNIKSCLWTKQMLRGLVGKSDQWCLSSNHSWITFQTWQHAVMTMICFRLSKSPSLSFVLKAQESLFQVAKKNNNEWILFSFLSLTVVLN